MYSVVTIVLSNGGYIPFQLTKNASIIFHDFLNQQLMTLRKAFIYTISVFSLITLVSYLVFR